MIEFLVFAAILVAASLLFVLLPLWRAGVPTPNRRRETNITIYHQRYAEIEREVSAGRLGRREAEMEKDELGARLLADIDETPALAGDARPRRRPWVATALVTVLLVAGAAGLYSVVGDWQAVQSGDMPDMAAMIGQLQARVSQNPDDLQALAMLARAEQATGDYAGAAETYRKINAAMPEPQPPLIAAEARATLQASDDLQGRAGDLYQQLLDAKPDSAEALWYVGLAAAERGDDAHAMQYWGRLMKLDLPDDFREMVRNRRDELAGDKPGLGSD